MRVGEFELLDPVPDLKDTCAIAMLRPWIDVGRVGTLALRTLEQYLGAKELGRLATPGKFFDFTRYRPRMRLVDGERVFTKPNTIVKYATDEYSKKNYLFVHVREPHNFGEDYTDAIVELFRHCQVTEYCRIGGMYDSIPHTRPLLITGSMNDEQEARAGKLLNPRKSTYQGPTSIVNQVNEDLTKLGTQNSTLMAHLPQYVQLDEDHLGASRLLEVLCSAYEFPQDLADKARGEQQYKDIDRAIDYKGEVGALIKQLETYYDRVLSKPEDRPDDGKDTDITDSSEEDDAQQPKLSSGIEDFLNQMGERFESDQGRRDLSGDDDVDDE